MNKRGRKSPGELSVVHGTSFGERPPPPADLGARQAEVWVETVASEPGAFFSTAVLKALLADYCRHRDSSEIISKLITVFQVEWLKEADGVKRYKELLNMRDVETRAGVSIAGKLRLTNQARYTPQAAITASKNSTVGGRPWEV